MTELFRFFSTISFFFDKGIDKPRNIGYNMIDGEATMTVASSVANLKR